MAAIALTATPLDARSAIGYVVIPMCVLVLLFIGSFILLSGYNSTGIVNRDNALISGLLLIPAIAGFSAGELLRDKIQAEQFKQLVLLLFLLLVLNFVRRSFIMWSNFNPRFNFETVIFRFVINANVHYRTKPVKYLL